MNRFLKGFKFALNGIYKAVKEERNLRIHLVTGLLVLAVSSFYSFNKQDYILLLILIGGMISLELVNSAIERAVDNPSEKHYLSAGDAKDIAAGAVLAFAAISAVCGFVLFWDTRVFLQILSFTVNNPLLATAAAIFFGIGYLWAFKLRKEDK